MKCLAGGTPTPHCRVLFGGKATFTGTLWGQGDYDLEGTDPAALPEGKITYEGSELITGGVKGCGRGTYIIDATEGYTDMTTYDPLTDSAEGYSKWQVRPGGGTGDLTNLVSGSGELRWKMHVKGFANITHFGEGDLTGAITCRD